MKKWILVLFFLLYVIPATPVKASIFGSIIDKVTSYALQAANALIFAQELIDVATYPNEYIRKVNSITNDINSIKYIAINSDLSQGAVGDLGVLLNNATLALSSSLTEFSTVLSEITEYTTMSTMGITTKLSDVLKNVKESHRRNMTNLNRIHSQVYSLRAALTQKSQMLSTSKKMQQIDIYKSRP